MAEAGNGQSVRNSTGKLKGKAKGPDEGPNYLRASTGSCHDSCKYGTPHEFKPRPKRPVRRSSMSNAEIPIEIFTPSDKRSVRAVKPSSASPPDAKVAVKQEAVVVSGKSSTSKPVRQPPLASVASPPDAKVAAKHEAAVVSEASSTSKLVRQQASASTASPPDAKVAAKQEAVVVSGASSTSKPVRQPPSASTKVRSSQVSKQIGEGVSALIKGESSLDAKSVSPDLLNLAKKEPSLDVKSLSADSAMPVNKQESSLVRQPPSASTASPPVANVAEKQEAVIVSGTSSTSKPVRQQASASTKVKSSQVPKQIGEGVPALIKGETSLDAKPMSPDLLNLAKKKPSLDVKSLSADSAIPSFLKKGSSSERRSSTSTLKSTVQDAQSRRKSSLSNVAGLSVVPVSSSKTSVVGRKSSSLDASKSVKPLATPSTAKASLRKNDTSTKFAGSSLKSKPSRARSEQSSSSNLVASRIGSKIVSGSRTSTKKASSTTSLAPHTQSVALTPNLPGTKVARLKVRSSITNTEGSTSSSSSRRVEASSSSKKPEVPEKTLHMIELESSNQQSPASFDSLCQSKSAFSSQDAAETESESEYTDSEVDDTVSSYRRGPGKDRVTDNDTEAIKLKFRRGKVIDPENEANSPRRLRFRKKTVSEDERTAENKMKVVLRHQDVQEKRNDQGTLNDMIEEAANKLKETRKSKVKALVGAFESVMSLQEMKPAPNLSPGR